MTSLNIDYRIVTIDFITFSYPLDSSDPNTSRDRVRKVNEAFKDEGKRLATIPKERQPNYSTYYCKYKRELLLEHLANLAIAIYSNKHGHFLSVSFIPDRLTHDHLKEIIEILNRLLKPIQESAADIMKYSKISRLDIAFDLPLNMATLAFTAQYIRKSGLYLMGEFPSSIYLGSNKSSRFNIYDRGLKERKKNQKFSDIAGKWTRIELRLKLKDWYSLAELTTLLDEKVSCYLKRLHVYRWRKNETLEPGSDYDLFLAACNSRGFEAMRKALISYDCQHKTHRAKRFIARYLRVVELNQKKMMFHAKKQANVFIRWLKETIRALDTK